MKTILIKSSILFNLNDPKHLNLLNYYQIQRLFFADINSRTFDVESILKEKLMIMI